MENFSTFRNSKKQNESSITESFHTIGMSTSAMPIKPKRLLSEVEELLNQRLGDEYTAYFFYRNAANWCKNANYKKAADFFNKEAEGELEHAKGLQDYLTQWNTLPVIPQVPTVLNFASLVDIINKAYMIEETLLLTYSENQKYLANVDPATFNFIQKYVDIQNGEVEEYSDYLNALELINVSSKFEILYFEQTYF